MVVVPAGHLTTGSVAGTVVGAALGSAWWLGPLVVLGGYAYPFLDFIETARITTAVTSVPGILRGASDWVAYIIDAEGHPVWQSGWVVAQGTASIGPRAEAPALIRALIEKGVDIDEVKASRDDGVVSRDDVSAAAGASTPRHMRPDAPTAPAAPSAVDAAAAARSTAPERPVVPAAAPAASGGLTDERLRSERAHV